MAQGYRKRTDGEHTKGYKQGFDDGVKKCIEYLKRNSHEQTI
uniref:Uncharacterized protein n=1 Tax=Siphoviridae sp. ctlHU7 TaxID=2827588 RepID=A0A8S5LHR2_9CAUD|nr:MAG TPA: hypothetical protein [Siphoviridae sp. ctlHU7]